MTSRPMLFSAPMVRAILDGRKTVTRRVVDIKKFGGPNETHESRGSFRCENGLWSSSAGRYNVWSAPKPCPYGHPGDKIWVKETWSQDANTMYPCPKVWYRATDSPDLHRGMHTCPSRGKSDQRYADCLECWEMAHGPFRWKPSIFMPRRFSRITLVVEDVRVERLQDITEEDAVAEGIQSTGAGRYWIAAFNQGFTARSSAALAYRDLWQSINGPGSWDANPFVWRVQFRRV